MSSTLIVGNRVTANTKYLKDPQALNSYLKSCPEIKKILFVFWSWKVPNEILDKYECYGMHTGPLLEGIGRGGNPIGNLRQLGVRITTLCAFKMTEKIDGGKVKLAIPIYLDDEHLIDTIDDCVPEIADYLFTEQPPIPEFFKRADVKS